MPIVEKSRFDTPVYTWRQARRRQLAEFLYFSLKDLTG
jgi:hypothetical protein